MRTRPIADERMLQQENLPLPLVEYPGLYGTFIGYRETAETPLVFCACQRTAIANCIHMTAAEPMQNNSSPARCCVVNSLHFPESICLRVAHAGIRHPEDAIATIPFRNCVCHRCNQRVPACLYCHEMYAAPFEQSFGWYLNSSIFGLNSNPRHTLTPDKTPMTRRAIQLAAEHDVRRAFGFPTRGARLTSEVIMFLLVRSAFNAEPVIHHYRAPFLGRLELDVFIPSLGIAIEYQGDQHFVAMDHWGGEQALARTVERDRTKLRLCEEHGITILYCADDIWQCTEESLRELILRATTKKKKRWPNRLHRTRRSRLG